MSQRESAAQSQCHQPVVPGWFCSPRPTLELPGAGQVLLMTLFPSSGNCPRKTPREIQESQHNHFVMWESDVTVRWRSFTQGDAGMRQGWIRLLGTGRTCPQHRETPGTRSRFLLGWLWSSQGCTGSALQGLTSLGSVQMILL